jgi:hypothetical protein
VGVLRLGHRLDRHVDLQVERLADARVDDRCTSAWADHVAADLLERVLRRGEPDALHLVLRVQRAEPLERQRHVRAALGRRDRVDLVEDDALDVLEHRPRLRVRMR